MMAPQAVTRVPIPIHDFSSYTVGTDGTIESKTGRVKKATPDSDGYLRISLQQDGLKLTTLVHRLVLMAFVGPCPPGCQALHKNGNRADNRLDNLRWGTPKENSADKKLHGTHIATRKLSDEQVREILVRMSNGERAFELGPEFGVCPNTIRFIGKRKTMSHVAIDDETSKRLAAAPKLGVGHLNSVSKMTDEDARIAKKELAEGRSVRLIAKDRGVSPTTIYAIRDGRTWRHV